MKTSVEWLISQILEDQIIKAKSVGEWEIVFQKAKAMEKEHIIDAWDNGFANGYDLGKYDDDCNPDDAEQYYNETFKDE